MATNSLLNHPYKQIIFFDSYCMLCSRFIKILLKADNGKFYFSGFDSAIAIDLLATEIRENPTTVVFYSEGNLHVKSEAIFNIIRELKFPWRIIGIFKILPTSLSDSIYDLVSRKRTSWFGRSETCFLPTPDQQARFIE